MDRAQINDFEEAAVPADAAARGIVHAVMLSSVFWVGFAITLWSLC